MAAYLTTLPPWSLHWQHEKVPFPPNKALKTWNHYTMNKKTGKPGEEMFYGAFQKLVTATPLLMLPLTRLQEKVVSANLGQEFWRNQKQLMVGTRKRLGIKRDMMR